MPCPGSEKAFYREVGLAPAKPTPAVSNPAVAASATAISQSTAQSSTGTPATPTTTPIKTIQAPVECKPQIHKKTGGTLPCPAPD